MAVATIQAQDRNGSANKIRYKGFTPGVIYGKDIDTKEVQFNSSNLTKLLKENTKATTLRVVLGGKNKQCVVKAVQKNLHGHVIHVDMQAISDNEEVKLKVPVSFTGRSMLENKNLLLETLFAEIEVSGKFKYIPETIEIDVENKVFGDKIAIKDLDLGENITALQDPEELIAVISATR